MNAHRWPPRRQISNFNSASVCLCSFDFLYNHSSDVLQTCDGQFKQKYNSIFTVDQFDKSSIIPPKWLCLAKAGNSLKSSSPYTHSSVKLPNFSIDHTTGWHHGVHSLLQSMSWYTHPSRLILRVRSSHRFLVSTKMMVLFSFSAIISSISWISLRKAKEANAL